MFLTESRTFLRVLKVLHRFFVSGRNTESNVLQELREYIIIPSSL